MGKESQQQTMAKLSDERWRDLLAAHTGYTANVPLHYDEVLHEVAERAEVTGSLGKADIGALLLWKRLRADTPWVRRLMEVADQEVREHTAAAVAAVRDLSEPVPVAASRGRRALSPLPGFETGDALASALLMAGAPKRMAVYDRQAQRALDWLGLPLSARPGRYGRYMSLVADLAEQAHTRGHLWSARDVDVALFTLGRRLDKARRTGESID